MSDHQKPWRPIAEPRPFRSPDDIPTVPDPADQIRLKHGTWRSIKRHKGLLGLVILIASSTASGVAYTVSGGQQQRLATVEANERRDHEDIHWAVEVLWQLALANHLAVQPPPTHGPQEQK